MLWAAVASFALIALRLIARVLTLAILIALYLLVARGAHSSGFVLRWVRAMLVQTYMRVGAAELCGGKAVTAA